MAPKKAPKRQLRAAKPAPRGRRGLLGALVVCSSDDEDYQPEDHTPSKKAAGPQPRTAARGARRGGRTGQRQRQQTAPASRRTRRGAGADEDGSGGSSSDDPDETLSQRRQRLFLAQPASPAAAPRRAPAAAAAARGSTGEFAALPLNVLSQVRIWVSQLCS
jgi:hypothetical protein